MPAAKVTDFDYLVAIGASAGGLDPLESFFESLPVDTGMAFVVVQHLSPNFKSMMPELLGRKTRMPIRRVDEGMLLERDAVHLIPAGMEMTLKDGRLHLEGQDRDNHQPQYPIDAFFRSAAEDLGDRVIGIVMSGTGSDGSQGISAIKRAGGRTIAQDEVSAKFDGMPRSSIATGMVDEVLVPSDMAESIIAHSRRFLLTDEDGTPIDASDGLSKVLEILRGSTSLDFSLYKVTTVRRRTERRMKLAGLETLHEYAAKIEEDEGELQQLYRDLLIGVTRFFRDREAFQHLADRVVPSLFANRSGDDAEVRVWVTACASGEEAYSIAMLLLEFAETLDDPPRIRVFATDLHPASLQVASAGRYGIEVLSEVSPERLARFFAPVGDKFQVTPALRGVITFAPHDLLSDAPFTRIDLVTCRNLLIYLRPRAQLKVLTLLHFALPPGGILFLGPSETTSSLRNEFSPIDGHWRIYKKLFDSRVLPVLPDVASTTMATRPLRAQARLRTQRLDSEVARERAITGAYDELLATYMPPGLLIGPHRELVHTFGEARRYLEPSTGRASLDVLALVPSGLRIALGTVLQRAIHERAEVSFSGVEFVVGEESRTHTVTARPLDDQRNSDRDFLVLVLIEDEGAARAAESPRRGPGEAAASAVEFDASEATEAKIEALETELHYARENLQATVEELETSNEELNATNEELMASNEELQSTNEELHSVNEELYTVNSEFQRKITELTELSDDMDNLLKSIEVGVVFLDPRGRIRRFTPAATRYFSLREQDLGRPLEEITHNLEDFEVLGDLASVSGGGPPVERETVSTEGTRLLARVLPYLRQDGTVQGSVLTLVDTTLLHRARVALESAIKRFEAFSGVAPVLEWAFDEQGRYVLANKAYQGLLGMVEANCIGRRPEDVLSPESLTAFHRPGGGTGSEPRSAASVDYEVVLPHEEGPRRVLVATFTFEDADGHVLSGGVGTDVTELRRVSDERDHFARRFEIAIRGSGCGLWDWEVATGVASCDDRYFSMLGYSEPIEPWGFEEWKRIVHPDDLEGVLAAIDDHISGRSDFYRVSYRMRRADGAYAWIMAAGEATERDADGRPARLTGIQVDVEEMKQAEAVMARLNDELTESNSELEVRNDELNQFVRAASHDLKSPLRTVVSFAEFAADSLREGDEADALNSLERVRAAALRMGRLIDSLLGFARVGRVDLQEVEISLGEVVEQAWADLDSEVADSQARIEVEGELPIVRGDAATLAQLFQNLFGNALKYREDGRDPRIRVRCTSQPKYVVVSVIDNGRGFDSADGERLFLPFHRLQSDEERQGSGIGLSICRRVAERHGGQVCADGKPGEGALFAVSFPRSRVVENASTTGA